MHQILLSGNVGKDATIKDVNGSKAISFTVAVNDTFTKDGEKKQTTTWYDCTIWRKEKQSIKIAEFLKVGQQVLIQGRPKPGGYQDKDNKWVGTIEVRVSSIDLMGKKAGSTGTKQAGDADDTGAFYSASEDDDNDLPF